MAAMPIIADTDVEPTKYVLDERFARPVPPLAEHSRGRTMKRFVLTSEGLRKFVSDNTKTTKQTREFLHSLGCTWDKDGKIAVHPI